MLQTPANANPKDWKTCKKHGINSAPIDMKSKKLVTQDKIRYVIMLFPPPSSSLHAFLPLRLLTSGFRYTPAILKVNFIWRYQESKEVGQEISVFKI